MYNSKLSSKRVVTEQAIGLLKNRFRRLRYLNISSVELASKMVMAVCMLHNVCSKHAHEDSELMMDYNSHPFVHKVFLSKGKSLTVVLYTQQQLADMKRFWCADDLSTTRSDLGVDRTFNLGACFVTVVVYKFRGSGDITWHLSPDTWVCFYCFDDLECLWRSSTERLNSLSAASPVTWQWVCAKVEFNCRLQLWKPLLLVP